MQRSVNRCVSGLVMAMACVLFAAEESFARVQYVRFLVSKEDTVYVQFDKMEMRAATSAEGLRDAESVEGTRAGHYIVFPALDLPVPDAAATDAPRRPVALSVSLHRGGMKWIYAKFGANLTDEQGVVWSYLPSRDWRSHLGDEPTAAPAVRPEYHALNPDALREAGKGTLQIVGNVNPGGDGIVILLHLRAGNTPLAEVHKDGRNVDAEVRVLDSEGNEVAFAKRPLSRFAPGNPPYVVNVDKKGTYTCEATLDAGPLGSPLRAETQVTVP